MSVTTRPIKDTLTGSGELTMIDQLVPFGNNHARRWLVGIE